jgi:hypothetical protein
MMEARQDHRARRFELAATVLLAMAAVATAWAAYQSARWHGEQAKAQSASIAARVESGMLRAQAAADLHGERTGGGAGPPPPPIN